MYYLNSKLAIVRLLGGHFRDFDESRLRVSISPFSGYKENAVFSHCHGSGLKRSQIKTTFMTIVNFIE